MTLKTATKKVEQKNLNKQNNCSKTAQSTTQIYLHGLHFHESTTQFWKKGKKILIIWYPVMISWLFNGEIWQKCVIWTPNLGSPLALCSRPMSHRSWICWALMKSVFKIRWAYCKMKENGFFTKKMKIFFMYLKKKKKKKILKNLLNSIFRLNVTESWQDLFRRGSSKNYYGKTCIY